MKYLTHYYLMNGNIPVLRRKLFDFFFWPWKDWEAFDSKIHKKQEDLNKLAHKMEDLVADLEELNAERNEIIRDVHASRGTKQGEGPRRWMKMSFFKGKPSEINTPVDQTWKDFYHFVVRGTTPRGQRSDRGIEGIIMSPASMQSNGATVEIAEGHVISEVSHPIRQPQQSRRSRKGQPQQPKG